MRRTLPMRLLAVALCVTMLATVIPLFAAAETAISEIVITDADITPVIGKPAGDFLSYTLPDNAPYTCTSYYWYNDTKGAQLKADDTFVEGDLYSLFVSLEPKDGYAFANGASVSINGGEGSADEENTWIMSSIAAIWMERTAAVTALPIKKILITDVDNTSLVLGERAGNNKATYALPDNAHFTCTDCYWYSVKNRKPLSDNETFEKGDVYFWVWEIVPDEGYAFSGGYGSISLYTADGKIQPVSNESEITRDHGSIYTGFFAPTDRSEISEINLFDADLTPVAGEKAGDHLSYTVPADAPYTCTHQFWFNDSTGESLAEDDLFAPGNSYSLAWIITADDGHTFNTAMDITIDGDTENVDLNNTLLGETQCTVWTHSIPALVLPITEISLTEANVTPVVSEKAGDHLAYTLPDDAEFTCTEHYWYNDTEGVKLGDNDAFAEGNSYSLKWVLVPNAGYVFDTDASVSINGGETSIDEENTSVAENQCVISTPSTEAIVSKEIHTINLMCSETLMAGAKVSDYMDASVPDDAKYTCVDFWWFNTDRWEDVSVNGIFVEEVQYITRWDLRTKEGYSFADDVKILVNGVEGKIGELTQINGDTANIWTTPIETEPPTLISKVELTDMDVTPVLGQKSGDWLHVTLPENCGYTVNEHVWHDVKTWYHVGPDEVFRDDREYFVYITFTTLPGYAFSEDAQATINGSTDSIDAEHCGCEGTHGFVIWTKTTKTPPPTAISEINLTDVDMTPVVGDRNGDWLHVTLPKDCGYTVSGQFWHNVETGDMDADEVFYAGASYRVTFKLKAEPGYVFAEDAVVTVNGSAELVYAGNSRRLSDNEFRVWTTDVQTPPPIVISEINLTDADITPVADMRAGDLQHVTVPENCGYTVSNYVWNEYGVGNCKDDDIFVAGTSYRAIIRLEADPEYAFSEDAVVTINGSTAEVDTYYSEMYNSHEFGVWAKPKEAQFAFDLDSGIHLKVGKAWVSTKNAADILGDGRASYDDATKTLTLQNFTMLGCSYVEEVETYCSIYADQYITINVVGSSMVHQGMETLDKPCCGIYISGSGDECPPLLTGDGTFSVYSGDTTSGDSTAVYEAAENVEIASTGKLLFQAGLCGDEGESNPLSCRGSVFFSGLNVKHDLSLLSAKEFTVQCAFPCEVKATLFTAGDYECVEAPAESFEKKDGLIYFNLGEGYAEAYISFLETVIDTIKIDGFHDPIIGGKASDYLTFAIPEDAHYHFDEDAPYWKNDTDGVRMDGNDTFETEKMYSLGGCLVADEGYVFAEKPTILLNDGGFAVLKERTKIDGLDAHIFNVWGESKQSVLGVIDKIEIDGFCDVVIGDKAGDCLHLTLPEGVHYRFVEDSVCWMNDTDCVNMELADTFEADKLYTLGGALVADEGYIFAKHPTILFNGGQFGIEKKYTYIKSTDARYFFFSGEAKKAGNPSETTEPTGSEALLGDANDDDAVNMKDVLTLRKQLAGMDVSYNAQNSDVNGDGEVNMKDVLMLRKFLAGLIEQLGA